MAGERSYRRYSVIPELRRLHSPDLWDLRTSTPGDPTNFCVLVQAMIGPKDELGEESFDFSVCTPTWIQEALSRESFVFGKYYLIVERYSYDVIWKAIMSICQGVSGSNWNEVAERLSVYGQWEFKNYKDFEGD